MAHGPSKGRTASQSEAREPNLIPIMNLFIVIIPMLMTIMVSVRLAMIEITLPTANPAAEEGSAGEVVAEDDVPRMLTLALFPDRFEVRVEGVNDVTEIPQLSSGTYDYITLDKEVAKLREQNPKQFTMEILPDPTVKFDTLLRCIDICKSYQFPNIKYLTAATKYYKAK
ncbi:MAG: biopolymer transporter ExbD [Candidatus Cloacimonadales bacterium]|nr:biopolymer transporter ExbD [Candidatus Cloacimonadales bacterium]